MLIDHQAEAARLGKIARDKRVEPCEKNRLTAELAYARNAARPNQYRIARLLKRLEELER